MNKQKPQSGHGTKKVSPAEIEREQLLEDYISEYDFAEAFDKSHRTVVRWRMEGDGPPHTYLGKSVWYSRKGIRRWLEDISDEVSN